MKTKNSTPWCKLYYSALKYNIAVSPSKHRAIFNWSFYTAFIYLTITVLFGFYIWLSLLCVGCLILLNYFHRQISLLLSNQPSFSLNTSISHSILGNFVLSDTGECQFNSQEILQISAKSQINLWGYWLVFTKSDAALKKHFVFKDSISRQDQARIARTILRMKKYG